jgi:glyoxylase-like metal-dependent hydrolase (beta-lactamase superfamily II)
MTAPVAKPATGLNAAIVPVTPFEQNCTLIWDRETMLGAVIDPGGDLDRIDAVIAEVASRSRRSR